MIYFERCLADTIGSYKIPADICQALNLDNHSRVIRPDWLRRSLYKFNSRLMTMTADSYRISLVGRPSSSRRAASRLSLRQTLTLISRGIIDRRRKWPTIVLAIYLVIMIQLCINTWFQYIQDANWIMLRRLETRLSVASERQRLLEELHLDVDQLRQQFSERLVESRRVLELIGASFSNWHFVIENFNLIFLQTFNWLVLMPIGSQFNNWNVLAARAIVDEENEKRVQVEMVLAEHERFKRDSLLFGRNRLMRLKRDLGLVWEGHQQGIAPEFKAGKKINIIMDDMLQAEQRRLERNHEMNLRRFKLNALRGRLNPLNRTPASRDKLALLYILVYICYLLYANCVIALVMYAFDVYFKSHYSERTAPIRISGLRDLWSSAYYVILIVICTLSGTFLLTIIVCAISDQMELAKRVRTLFMVVIKTNSRRFEEMILIGAGKQLDEFSQIPNKSLEQIEAAKSHQRGQLKRAILMDLVMLVAQFRLALTSFEQSKRVTQQIALVIFFFALSIPFVWLIHCTYLDDYLRYIVLGACTSAALCCLTFLLPVALLYRRHVSLVKSLWTLVGQLSQYEQLPDVNKYVHLNSNVTLFIFRRLTFDSDLLVERLSVSVLSMPVTYVNLFRAFSYCITLMMIAGFMTLHLFGDGLASIMTDPFRLFKFLQVD